MLNSEDPTIAVERFVILLLVGLPLFAVILACTIPWYIFTKAWVLMHKLTTWALD